MERREFTFPSADGKTQIHAAEWLPEGAPRAILQISHGVSEYILRYEPFAEFLTGHGIAVAGHDHLGHGNSAVPGAPRLYFGPRGSWNWAAEDIRARRQLMREQFPGVPYFLLGHSMGSFLARTDLILHPGEVDGAILMGTGQMAPPLLAAGRAVAAAESLRMGETRASPLVEKLAFGAYNRVFAPNRTAYDWLSRDPENVDRYLADPLCGGSPTIGLFREMLAGMAFIARPENLRKMDLSAPVLFISGARDPVGDCGKGVRRAAESFRKAGAKQVSLRLYPELRHEILNEDCREEIYADLLNWLMSAASKTAASWSVSAAAGGGASHPES